ncbi:MAG TPA: Rid family detoxifying hydrolase [Actinomycetota bacterium]|nr:Rid family detoxifying hydrolase [Actinomycetota bacterium]
MDREVVATEAAPAAVGPYSQAIVAGDLIFCSGQIPLDPDTGELVSGSIADETSRCMDNLAAVLAAAGSDLGRVVKFTVFLTDIADYAEFNEAFARFVGGAPPARAAVAVAGLPKGARVEVECIALRRV